MYLPCDVRRLYGVPPAFTGKGQQIGILSLGGTVNASDLDASRDRQGLAPNPVRIVSVLEAQLTADAPAENATDVQIASGMAPDAEIIVYVCPATEAGIAAGIAQLVADGCTFGSMSWGAPEAQCSASGSAAIGAQLERAAKRNVSIFVAPGDAGSKDGTAGLAVELPASSPWATAVGGTSILPDGSEVVWNDGRGATGGGFSILYRRPSYQDGAHPKVWRGIPDMAALATDWWICVGGVWQQIEGTSASAPCWAGIAACLAEAAGGKLGWVNTWSYKHPEAFRDVLSGTNGDYQATPGWDAVSGLGSPDGEKLFALAASGALAPSAGGVWGWLGSVKSWLAGANPFAA